MNTCPLNEKLLKSFVQNHSSFFNNIIYYKNIDSTNIESFRIANKYEGNFIIISDYQSAGKGQFNRKWFSPECENLYFSLVIKDKIHFKNSLLVITTASTVIKTLSQYNINAFIKWPNDIIVKKKKICGILIEEKYNKNIRDLIVIGIGININTNFKKIKELKRIAISVAQLLKRNISREEFFIKFLQNFENELKRIQICQEEIFNFYLKYLYKLNKKIKFKTGTKLIKGILSGVDKNGSIILKNREGEHYFTTGEIILN